MGRRLWKWSSLVRHPSGPARVLTRRPALYPWRGVRRRALTNGRLAVSRPYWRLVAVPTVRIWLAPSMVAPVRGSDDRVAVLENRYRPGSGRAKNCRPLHQLVAPARLLTINRRQRRCLCSFLQQSREDLRPVLSAQGMTERLTRWFSAALFVFDGTDLQQNWLGGVQMHGFRQT